MFETESVAMIVALVLQFDSHSSLRKKANKFFPKLKDKTEVQSSEVACPRLHCHNQILCLHYFIPGCQHVFCFF